MTSPIVDSRCFKKHGLVVDGGGKSISSSSNIQNDAKHTLRLHFLNFNWRVGFKSRGPNSFSNGGALG